LRERKEDIPLLIKGLIVKYNHLQGKGVTGVSPEALARLMLHYYPGNVRELENIIEQAFVLRPKGTIQLEDLPLELQERSATAGSGLSLEALERSAVEEALRRAGGHRGKAAGDLGIDPSTLYRKMKTLGITPPAADGRSRKRH
jgi:DNA-binding NtrC family response regulator